MTTTPPSRSRANTPPTPLHGSKFDTYEPYPPRRSSRQANKQSLASSNDMSGSYSGVTKPVSRKVAQGSLDKQARQTALGQVISPPSSPATPRASERRYRDDIHVMQSEVQTASDDSDVGMNDPHLLVRRGPTAFPHMLPTPKKTPRKRDHKYETRVSTTSRVLFPGKSASLDDRMPALRKARRSNKHIAFSLDSPPAGSGISIYTDSKDRIPDVEDAEENPFLAKQTRASHASTSPINTRFKHGMTAEIDRAVENGEGMVYTFRRKKIYKKFSDADDDHDVVETLEDQALLHRAGETARRPLTRSAIKPRLLFPPKPPSVDTNPSDEEALTDIEEGVVPETESEEELETSDEHSNGYRYNNAIRARDGRFSTHQKTGPPKATRGMLPSTPPRKRSLSPELGVTPLRVDLHFNMEGTGFLSSSNDNLDSVSTPVRMSSRLVTPPTTVHKNKHRGSKLTPDLSPFVPELEFAPLPAVRRMHDPPASPFDEWSRTKPNTRSVSAKRAGEPMSVEAKRMRTDAHERDSQ